MEFYLNQQKTYENQIMYAFSYYEITIITNT